MPDFFREFYFDYEGEQSIEQLRLSIKMMLTEWTIWNFIAGVPVTRTRAAVGGFWTPSRNGFGPRYQKASPVPG
jgi:hypothetical protein